VDNEVESMKNNQKVVKNECYIKSVEDFEFLKTNVYLIKGVDTLFSLLIDDAYGSSIIKRFGKNLFILKRPYRGGVGMKREEIILLLRKENKLHVLLSKNLKTILYLMIWMRLIYAKNLN